MNWTRFMDMHSGGGQKLQWAYVYIEAPEATAKSVFEKLLGRDPEHVTCNCCGGDYSINEEPNLEEASAYERRGASLEEYAKRADVRIVPRREVLAALGLKDQSPKDQGGTDV